MDTACIVLIDCVLREGAMPMNGMLLAWPAQAAAVWSVLAWQVAEWFK
jgi:hypothetical protein